MKCPKCGGTGWDIVHGFDCVSCDGKGEIEVTNEEWLKQANTEQLADYLSRITIDAWFSQVNQELPKPNGRNEWVEWLKQQHRNEVEK